ncbi:hypothetical protein BGX34_005573 [Mortierella sp. NVP85]|nr:hypothetical protein BGX34_005573 [Mortierella sp. NVP85]
MDTHPPCDLLASHMITGTSNEAATDNLFDFFLLSEMEYCKALIDLPPKDTAERKTPTFAERLDETTQTSVIPLENADYRLHTAGALDTPTNTIPSTESPSLLLDFASLNAGFDMSSTSLDPSRYIPTRVMMASSPDIPDIWSLQDHFYQPFSGSSITQNPFPAIDLPPLATPTAIAFENPTMTASDSVFTLLPDWSFSFSQPLTSLTSLDPSMHPILLSQATSSVPILQAPESSYVASDPLMSQGSSGEVLLTGLLSSCYHSSILSQHPQFSALPGISCDVEQSTESLESPKKPSKKRRLSDVIPPGFPSPERPESCKRKRMESSLSRETLAKWPPKEEEHPSSPKSGDIKKVTDSAHYRPRNAFFMFRGFVSRIQTNLTPKWRRDSSFLSVHKQPTGHTLPSSSPSLSTIKSTLPRSRKTPALAQTKVSASDYLKLRQTELERRIEFSEGCSSHHDPHYHLSLTPLHAQGSSNESHYNPLTGDESGDRTIDEDKHSEPDPSIGRLARMTLEDSFNWKEFQQLYYESDLFQWHREAYLGNDGILDLEEMKRLWVENERCYEKSFVEGAKKRFLQDGSKNSKKARQRRIG